MINYTDIFSRIQAAEKEARGMALRTTPDGKLTEGAEREIEYLLARHGITGAKAVLDSRNILHLVPNRGRKPALTALQNAQREYERISKGWDPQSKIYKDALNGLLGAITDTLAGQELAAQAELVRRSELARPVYKFTVDRTHDPLTDGVLKGTMTVTDPPPVKPATTPSGKPCNCFACTLVREVESAGKAAKPKGVDYQNLECRLLAELLKPMSYQDLFREVDREISKAIYGQGLFSDPPYSKKPNEPAKNTYRDGPVKEEASKPSVLAIKEKARVAFSFPVGSINSAMLGDALGDAYKAGAESVKPETAYAGELRAALQGHGFSGSNTEWHRLLTDVATMVRNARGRRGY